MKEVVDLLNKIKDGSADIAIISKRTGIAAGKMYKWRERDSDISLSDAIKLQEYLKESDNCTINDPGVDYESHAVSLKRILEEILLTRADVRAFGEYQVMKDAKGDEGVRSAIMEQINKLVGLNLQAGVKTGTPAGIQGKG